MSEIGTSWPIDLTLPLPAPGWIADVAQPLHKVIAEFPAVVLFDEAQEAPVPDASNDHAHKIVRLHRTLVNCLAPKTGSRRRGALASREVA